jgi:hypothetical protein
MKPRLIILLACIPFSFANAQPDTLENRFLLNFVIPDMPAYKSLGIEKSDLLRPSDVKDFALMLSPFINNGKPAIPKNFGLEFAPWKMASKKWTLSDYNKKAGMRFLYNSSFSIGAVVDSTAYSSKFSVGYRFALLSNKADIVRIAFDRSSAFAATAQKANELKARYELHWLTQVVQPRVPADQHEEYLNNHLKEYHEWLSSINPKDTSLSNALKAIVLDTKNIFGDEFDFSQLKTSTFNDVESSLLDKLILDYKNQNWNASRFDAAIAWVGESPDSAVSHTRFSSFNVWATGALKLGKRGQLLIGGNLKLPNNSVDPEETNPIRFSASARLLLGNPNFRFFGETQWQYLNYGITQNEILINLGGEIRISQKFWVVVSSGINNAKNKAAGDWTNQIVTNLDLRYGFNL